MWYSTTASVSGVLPLDAVQVGSQLSYGNTLAFSGLSRAITTPCYLYLTVTTHNGTAADRVTVTVQQATDIQFSTGIAYGTFPLTTGNTVLPVTMVDFTASSRSGLVYLNWVTQSEVNNAGFAVLRRNAIDSAAEYSIVSSCDRFTMGGPLNTRSETGFSSTPLTYHFVDSSATPEVRYEYRIRAISFDGIIDDYPLTAHVTVAAVPTEFALQQNYPNPFNSSTMVRFAVPSTGQVTLVIYDMNGRQVRMLTNNVWSAGTYSLLWDGRNASGMQVASGTYVLSMKAGKFQSAKKLLLLK